MDDNFLTRPFWTFFGGVVVSYLVNTWLGKYEGDEWRALGISLALGVFGGLALEGIKYGVERLALNLTFRNNREE